MISSITIRKIVQLSVFGLFLLTVLQATYPYSPWIPPELFLWLDPVAGILTMIATRTWIPWFLLSLIVLLSPLIIGRAFCGWICPLGTIIDGTDLLLSPKKDTIKRRFSRWKLLILVFLFIVALLGTNFSWFMDPIPILWRTVGAVIFPIVTKMIDVIFIGLLDFRVAEDLVYNAFDFLSRSIIPLKPMIVHGALVVAIFFAIILGLSVLSKRFWCRNLCPLGALLGLIAKISPLQRVVDEEVCNSCALCSKNCKMAAIEEDFLTTEKSECIFCLNCSKECKVNGTTYSFQPMTSMTTSVDLSRRRFFGIAFSGFAATSVLKITYSPDSSPGDNIRPPGSVEEEMFFDRCIRCDECVRVCGTTGACLQPYYFETGLEGFLTPHADFKSGYCEYNCNICGEICPTGAIQTLSLEKKKKWKMGLAIIDKDVCIPYRMNENCIVCEEHCPTPEKAILFEKKQVQLPTSLTTKEVLYPIINSEHCIGCGICQVKCPIDGQPGVYIIREGEDRWEGN